MSNSKRVAHTPLSGSDVYKAMQKIGFTSTGSGEYQQMCSGVKAHVRDLAWGGAEWM